MGFTTASSKLKTPNDTRGKKGIATPTFQEDAVDSLSRARQGFVKNTGKKLKDVTTAKAYQKLSEAQKKEYKKRNPQDFKKKDEEFKLNKKSLLGE